MIFRMQLCELTEVVDFESLNGKVSAYYVECGICNSYRRLSYDKRIATAAIISHMDFQHSDIEDKVKNIIYKHVSVSKDKYMLLHDLILIDP